MKIENYERLKAITEAVKLLKLDVFTVEEYEGTDYFKVEIKFFEKLE